MKRIALCTALYITATWVGIALNPLHAKAIAACAHNKTGALVAHSFCMPQEKPRVIETMVADSPTILIRTCVNKTSRVLRQSDAKCRPAERPQPFVIGANEGLLCVASAKLLVPQRVRKTGREYCPPNQAKLFFLGAANNPAPTPNAAEEISSRLPALRDAAALITASTDPHAYDDKMPSLTLQLNALFKIAHPHAVLDTYDVAKQKLYDAAAAMDPSEKTIFDNTYAEMIAVRFGSIPPGELTAATETLLPMLIFLAEKQDSLATLPYSLDPVNPSPSALYNVFFTQAVTFIDEGV